MAPRNLLGELALEDTQLAGNATLASIDGHVDGLEALVTALNGTDFATETTLAAVLAALGDRASEATLAALAGVDFATGTDIGTLGSKLDTIITNTAQAVVDIATL